MSFVPIQASADGLSQLIKLDPTPLDTVLLRQGVEVMRYNAAGEYHTKAETHTGSELHTGSSQYQTLTIATQSGQPTYDTLNSDGNGITIQMNHASSGNYQLAFLQSGAARNNSNPMFRWSFAPSGPTIQSCTTDTSLKKDIHISGSAYFFDDLSVNGTVQTTGGNGQLTISSDSRLKSNISAVPDGALAIVDQLIPREFTWNSDPNPVKSVQRGFIAQEVETVLPVAIDGKKYEYELAKDDNGKIILNSDGTPQLTNIPRYRGLDSTAILSTVVKAIQELKKIVDQNASDIAAIKSKLGM